MADAARLRIEIGGDGSIDEDRAASAQALAREPRGLDAVREVKPATGGDAGGCEASRGPDDRLISWTSS
jgi:hypothetical protein